MASRATDHDHVWMPPERRTLALIAVLAGAALFALIGVGGYLASLRVAAARAEVARLDGLARSGRADIRTLQRDYEIRSRLRQLDRWRVPLMLAPATAGQFVAAGDTLAGAAAARRQALAEATPAPPKPTPTYTDAARTRLDDLIAAVSPG